MSLFHMAIQVNAVQWLPVISS